MKNEKLFFSCIVCMLCFTGLFAQQVDSMQIKADSVAAINTKEYNESKSAHKAGKILGIAIPSAMVLYGVASFNIDAIRDVDYDTRDWLVDHGHISNGSWEDYCLFIPAATAFGLKFCNVESKHNLFDMAAIYGISNIIDYGVVYTVKETTGRMRPDNSEANSFPSGHTSMAFVAAEFLHQEYGDKSIWISIGGYGCATLIGAARVVHNKHWVSDVVAGAGIGILSTKATYWAYPYIKEFFGRYIPCKSKKTNQALFFPSYNYQGGLSLNFSYSF